MSACYQLTANKTKLYRLIAQHFSDLPPRKETMYIKYFRSRDYALEFGYGGTFHHFFLSTMAGQPMLGHRTITDDDSGNGVEGWDAITLEMSELRDFELLEEVV